MRKLIDYLNARAKEYAEGCPTISDTEWDKLYFELQHLEKELGCIYPDSPTQNFNYNVVDKLNTVVHNTPMLSLDKVKDIEELSAFAEKEDSLLMTKMDGLSCELIYENGELIEASTRGDGIEGENVTHNALKIKNIPVKISYKERLVIHGEVIIKTDDFEKTEGYKHCRNYAAGAIRLLNSKESEGKNLRFIAWEVLEGLDDYTLLSEKLDTIKGFGFTIVPYIKFRHESIKEENIHEIFTITKKYYYPCDGAVVKYDLIELKDILGQTSHHFKNALAFKVIEDTYETKLIDIEWTMGRTGILTPVAIFESIEIDGCEVSRASLHNVSILEELLGCPYANQKLNVFKANQIIPQIKSAEKENLIDADYLDIPSKCPLCGGDTACETLNESTNLVCTNPMCEGKLINRLDYFCGKKGLDIKGLSKATLEKLIDWGWISSIVDIFALYKHKEEWCLQPGFGTRSVDKILSAIEESKNTTYAEFLSSLGIPLIGKSVSKDIFKHFSSYEALRKAIDENYDFSQIEGFGESKTNALLSYNYSYADEVAKFLKFAVKEDATFSQSNILEGFNFVITGKVYGVKNRAELQERIENLGGKVLSTVSPKVHYLINNDVHSTTSKNLKAKELNIPIITEEEYYFMEGAK